MNVDKKILAVLRSLPESPGVYRFMRGSVPLYIGKAKNLKSRVNSYFHSLHDQVSRKTRIESMLDQIDDIQFTVVNSELEAFLLETNQIKEYLPKYNVLMKDGKGYSYIRIDIQSDFPLIEIVRKIENDGALYFGPKTSTSKVRDVLDLLHKIFKFRNCNLHIKEVAPSQVTVSNKTINYPCLEYHINQCEAPCIGMIMKDKYKQNIAEIIQFLQGKTEHVIEAILSKITEAVANRNFEYAAKLRDKMNAIQSVQERQKIDETDLVSRDVISVALREGKAFFNVFIVRDGKLLDQENFILEGIVLDEFFDLEEVFEKFVYDYYSSTFDCPTEILLDTNDFDTEILTGWLHLRFQVHAIILFPKKGHKSKLLTMSRLNADNYANQCQIKWDTEHMRTVGACKELAALLSLPSEVRRIECYDISHLSGTHTVASMVVFENGVPKKSDYRHFTLRTIKTGEVDDFKSINEVIFRRFKHLPQTSLFDKYTLRAVKKNELELLNDFKLKGGWTATTSVSGYYFLIYKKTPIGIIATKEYKDFYHIKNIFLQNEFRGEKIGYHMLGLLISRIKKQLFYVVVDGNLESYYSEFGFKTIDVPDELTPSYEACRKKFSTTKVMKFHALTDFNKYLSPTYYITDENNQFSCGGTIGGSILFSFSGLKLDDHAVILNAVNIARQDLPQSLFNDLLSYVYQKSSITRMYIDDKMLSPFSTFLGIYFNQVREVAIKYQRFVPESAVCAYLETLFQKDSSLNSVPDLVVIDGGKGQLSSACKALSELKLNIPICSLAKKMEDIFVPNRSEPILIPKESPAQYLLQRARDEAHRFAITHNRDRRLNEMLGN